MRTILLAALAIVACAPTVQLHTDYRVGQSVPFGFEASSPVGGVVYSEFEYTSSDGARLDSPYRRSVALGRVDVPAGAVLRAVSIGSEPAFCTDDQTYSDPIAGPWRPTCYFDRDVDGRFEEMWVTPGAIPFTYPIEPAIGYRSAELSLGADGFKAELVYQGVANDVVRILYREYSDNFARPAFQQELTYNLDAQGGTEINFRAVRISILSADNNAIVFLVHSGFG